MIDKARIEEEANRFFEWPEGSDKLAVTTTSCLLFANVIAEMARAEERKRCIEWCEKVSQYHWSNPAPGDEVFIAGQGAGADDCIEAIKAEGDWP